MKTNIIAIVMQKGGTGKTTSSINIGAGMAKAGKKVLIVCLDPQGDATKILCKNTKITSSISNLLYSILDNVDVNETDIKEAIYEVNENFFILPSTDRLSVIQNRLIVEKSSDFMYDSGQVPTQEVLKCLLDKIKNHYDYIILDCPPSLSMLTINALVAADSVLLPVEAHKLGYGNIITTLGTIERIQKMFNPELEIKGLFLTKFQNGTNHAKDVLSNVYFKYGNEIHIFNSIIPLAISIADLPKYGTSIFDYAPKGKGAIAYSNLIEEVLAND